MGVYPAFGLGWSTNKVERFRLSNRRLYKEVAMRVAITGASGLIGRHLRKRLDEIGIETLSVKRVDLKTNPPNEIWWDPYRAKANIPKETQIDALIHLGGEPVASRRWNATVRSNIYSSRVYGTRGLVEALKALGQTNLSFISASAVGYYGSRGAEVLTESSDPGTGFLARVCKDWEKEAAKASDFGVRTCILRTGIVLAKDGGALPKAAIPFRLGAGGRLGDGRSYMPWIHIDDHVEAVIKLLMDQGTSGIYNLVDPNPVTNSEFTKALSKTLSRPAVLSVPAAALELILGKEMANETVLASQNARPRRLEELGFSFKFHDIYEALSALDL